MKDKNIRKITVTGETGTYYVTIPKDIIRDVKWRRGQRVIVSKRGRRVIITELPRKSVGNKL